MTALFLAALAVIACGGALALPTARNPALSTLAGAGACAAGCALGLVPAVATLMGAASPPLVAPWQVPFGAFHIALDGLSAFFLVPVFLLSGVAAVYGAGYLRHDRRPRARAASWLFFNALVASMALLVVARNGLLFLVAWEVMSLASYFLVTYHDDRPEVLAAGWTYLVATHIGTAFLLGFFALAASLAGSLEFDAIRRALAAVSPAVSGLLFVLAVIGFGTKAGFLPLHVWLPEAHPAAPSHVSAVMSGVMIKMGVYGLVRAVTLLPAPPPWWGMLLVAVGVTSGILGVLFALAQHDLKRLLAYHSVENIGIITLGLGVGLLGVAHGIPALAFLGCAGAFFHVLNHALFKGLLFLGAGAVAQGAGTLDIERLGGLLRRMRCTGTTFLVAAAAISGLPPLNGFASELLVYLGALDAALLPSPGMAVPGLVVIGSLALVGGLAAACFAKAFGIVFLGEPRSEQAARAREAGAAMRAAMVVLAGACVALGLGAPLVVRPLAAAVAGVARMAPGALSAQAASAHGTLAAFTAGGGALFLAVLGGVLLLRRRLLAGRPVTAAGTWDCGYAAPTARMQYTASSFAQPLTALFATFLRTRRHVTAPQGLFPAAAALESHTPDACRRLLFEPLFRRAAGALSRLRWLQHGQLRIYVLYIAVVLVALLVWKLS